MAVLYLVACTSGFLCPTASAQANDWTWMGGASTANTNGVEPGVYGTLKTPAAGNIPGGRTNQLSWIDNKGNFWLFGGWGNDSAGTTGALNDLWEFNPATGEWAWMAGGSTIPTTCYACGNPGVYGTLGTPGAANTPGGRQGAVGWTDNKGNLWLFGGAGIDSVGANGALNDLWEFNPAVGEWAWVGGSSTGGGSNVQHGIYGTLGTPSAANIPGGRWQAVGWTDSKGNLWLFGGDSYASSGDLNFLNDLWEFNPSTNEWVWMGGSDTFTDAFIGPPGVYGTVGVPSAGNVPGGRGGAAAWTDNKGNFWLFGGDGYDSVNDLGLLNDLWEFNSSTNEWVWVDGSNLLGSYGSQSSQYGVYDTWMTPNSGNMPGSRRYATAWTDKNDNLWLFGGDGLDSVGAWGSLNDLWEFNPSTNQWSWMGGNATEGNDGYLGIYGTLQVPSFENAPGTRKGGSGWTDSSGNLWLFGGEGAGYQNDLWRYQPYAGSLPVAATPTFSLSSGTYTSTQTVTISDATPGAAIYYFVGGSSAPTPYTQDLTISSPETIEAIAAVNGFENSAIATATYTVNLPVVATPTFSVQPDTYATTRAVSIADATPGATIYYAINGVPTTSSSVYTGAITVSSSETIEAIAVLNGYANSSVASADYIIWPATALNEWALVGGPFGNSSDLGLAFPVGRYQASGWTDKSGNFWLFGGYNKLAVVNDINVGIAGLNDLWKLDPTANSWTRIGGDITESCVPNDIGYGICTNARSGNYGTLGTPAAANFPGSRGGASSWTDSNGNLWLFGGSGLDANATPGYNALNDMWEFIPSSNEWAWMNGSSTINQSCFTDGGGEPHCAQPGIYGTLGTSAAGNTPGGRQGATTWTDSNGNFWLFGGAGFDIPSQSQYFFNDLWKFNPSTGQWTWMGGSSTTTGDACFDDSDLMYFAICGQAGVYGTQGTPSSANVPGGRTNATGWTDKQGNFWLFGGLGFDSNGTLSGEEDLWQFKPSTNEWTWMGGINTIPQACELFSDSTLCVIPLVYGTLGIPAAGNFPGPRSEAASWTDKSGNLWLFGGSGLNELWEFYPSTNEWAWMGGVNRSDCGPCSGAGVYGTLGVPAAGNIPDGTNGAVNWTDNSGNFWLFGSGPYAEDNNIWEYRPANGPLPTTAAPTFSVPAGSYDAAQTVLLNDATDGATIYYTTDGTTPTTSSSPFNPNYPISVPFSETLKAIAVASGCYPSAIVTATYTLSTDVAAPTFSLPAGTYATAQSVTISDATANVSIYYTTDGTTPTMNSLGFNGSSTPPINVSASETLTAIAVANGYGIPSIGDSPVVSATYILSLPLVATPTFSLAAGTYTSVQTVTLSDATTGATVYYTTNGAKPTTSSTVYGGPITVSSTETLQAIAVEPGYNDSAVASATYTINLPPPSFTVADSPTSMTVTAGQSGTTTVTVTPANGFNLSVTFSCSGLPVGAICLFSPPIVTPSGVAPISTTLTVTTSATTSALGRRGTPIFPAATLAVVVCLIRFRKRGRVQMLLFGVSVSLLGLVSSCGGGDTPPTTPQPVTSTVTITANGGSLQNTATFSLTVN